MAGHAGRSFEHTRSSAEQRSSAAARRFVRLSPALLRVCWGGGECEMWRRAGTGVSVELFVMNSIGVDVRLVLVGPLAGGRGRLDRAGSAICVIR